MNERRQRQNAERLIAALIERKPQYRPPINGLIPFETPGLYDDRPPRFLPPAFGRPPDYKAIVTADISEVIDDVGLGILAGLTETVVVATASQLVSPFWAPILTQVVMTKAHDDADARRLQTMGRVKVLVSVSVTALLVSYALRPGSGTNSPS